MYACMQTLHADQMPVVGKRIHKVVVQPELRSHATCSHIGLPSCGSRRVRLVGTVMCLPICLSHMQVCHADNTLIRMSQHSNLKSTCKDLAHASPEQLTGLVQRQHAS